MGDQDRLAETFVDRGAGVTQMDQKGRAADGGTVDPFRRNAEIVRHFRRFFPAACDTVDVTRLQAGFRHSIKRRVRVKLNVGHMRNFAEFRGLARADNGN